MYKSLGFLVFYCQCIIIVDFNTKITEQTLLHWFIGIVILIFDDLPSVSRFLNFIRLGLRHPRISSMTTLTF